MGLNIKNDETHRLAAQLAALGRVWQLRANVSAYDAAYIALAEALGARLVTADRRLAGVPGFEGSSRTRPVALVH